MSLIVGKNTVIFLSYKVVKKASIFAGNVGNRKTCLPCTSVWPDQTGIYISLYSEHIGQTH